MSPAIQVLLWGIATALAVLVNFRRQGDPDALGLAVMILLIWIMGRVTGALWSPPQSMASYPVIDFIAGCVAATAWSTRPAPWKIVLAGLFLLQCLGHAAFWSARFFHGPGVDLLTYTAANNCIFAVQLAVVGWQGVHDGILAGSAGPRMRRRARARSRPRG
jgi:hypothetical protein